MEMKSDSQKRWSLRNSQAMFVSFWLLCMHCTLFIHTWSIRATAAGVVTIDDCRPGSIHISAWYWAADELPDWWFVVYFPSILHRHFTSQFSILPSLWTWHCFPVFCVIHWHYFCICLRCTLIMIIIIKFLCVCDFRGTTDGASVTWNMISHADFVGFRIPVTQVHGTLACALGFGNHCEAADIYLLTQKCEFIVVIDWICCC